MGHWVKVGAEPLLILYEAYQNIFDTFYLQMDEIRFKVLEDGKGKTHLGFIWAVFDPIRRLPFFFYQVGRDHKGPKKLLQRFAGVLQCDGFGVYETLNKKIDSLALMNCMAHIRREFFDAQSNDAQRAQTALTLIQLLYQVEEKARNLGLNPRTTPRTAASGIKTHIRSTRPVAPLGIQPRYPRQRHRESHSIRPEPLEKHAPVPGQRQH
ncbi:MAG: transposase [Saprospirales bacterium]|nr:transposase [Saprospirales bacterium]